MSVALRSILFLAAAVMAIPLGAQEAVLFEEAADGILELAGHNRLKIEGFAGTVTVRAGKKGELRYAAATRAARREPRPVALWLKGGTMIFRPLEGREEEALILEIAVSDGVRVEISKTGGKAQVSGLATEVTVEAEQSDVQIVGVSAEVDVKLQGGQLLLEGLGAAPTVDATDVSAIELNQITGGANVTLTNSLATLGNINGGIVEIDLEDSRLKVSESPTRVRGTASGGRMTMYDVRRGVELRLDETPFNFDRCRGNFEIETDSEVTFKSLNGDLKITGFGGKIEGEGVTGSAVIENRDADVTLTSVAGQLELGGDALRVKLSAVEGALIARLSGSRIEGEGVSAGLDVTNDFGDVVFKNVKGAAKIVNINGNVRVTGLVGSAEIEAEGPEVRVAWGNLGQDNDSSVTNSGGDLFVDFPPVGGASVSAEASSIETELPDIQVDGETAQGMINKTSKPTVTVRASGRLVMTRGAAR